MKPAESKGKTRAARKQARRRYEWWQKNYEPRRHELRTAQSQEDADVRQPATFEIQRA